MLEKLWITIAWILPRSLVKWCFVRVASSATTGEHADELVSQLTVLEALRRWN